jgi:hypothetical protein
MKITLGRAEGTYQVRQVMRAGRVFISNQMAEASQGFARKGAKCQPHALVAHSQGGAAIHRVVTGALV